ncbi:MAG: YegS/Rv2252/BmrU family lipid kinase [Ruminococcaceae bacterium]|nr:YegS/Rv2252/BmrU family lipid kinase [Oscillospiraceae bacterium]
MQKLYAEGERMRYIFIVNPVAGNRSFAKKKMSEKIKDTAQTNKVSAEIRYTEKTGDVQNIIKSCVCEYPCEEIAFFACGGDGTLYEVVNGIMATGEAHRLFVGALPSGTGNDFVRNFLNSDAFFDINAQFNSTPMSIDLIKCNGVYGVNMVNIGFDCEVVCKKGAFQKHRFIPKKLAYIFGLAATLIKKPGVNCCILLDGERHEDEKLLLTTYANGEYCGGGFHSNPESSLSDGCIDTILVKDITRRKFVSIVGTYKKGTHLKYTQILSNKKAKKIDIFFEKTTNICVDGEVITAEELHLESIDSAIRFLVPAGCEYLKAQKSDKAEQTV